MTVKATALPAAVTEARSTQAFARVRTSTISTPSTAASATYRLPVTIACSTDGLQAADIRLRAATAASPASASPWGPVSRTGRATAIADVNASTSTPAGAQIPLE